MKFIKFALTLIGLAIASSSAYADTTSVKMYKVAPGNAEGEFIGTVTLSDQLGGLLITPYLKNLSPGAHGFHVHLNNSCADNGNAAGPHFDPDATTEHLGPYAKGHLGDLPALAVQNDGTDTQVIFAPRLSVEALKGHSLMIHANGDNYSDSPLPLGGGGARMVCGVV